MNMRSLCIFIFVNVETLSFFTIGSMFSRWSRIEQFQTNRKFPFINKKQKEPDTMANRQQFYLGGSFKPVTHEVQYSYRHNNSLFSELGGFYAQIGSNPQFPSSHGYHLFDGDGMIHGVFFNNSWIHYRNKWIKTRRFKVERKWKRKMYLQLGELRGLRGVLEILRYSVMEALGFLPPAKGTANTALMSWQNSTYALHESDMPYEIAIDQKNYSIHTLHRMNHTLLHSTTAHPKISKDNKSIYMYGYNNYDFSQGRFYCNKFNSSMDLVERTIVKLRNNGIVHDVGFTGRYMIIPDMPLKYDPGRILQKELPLYFDKKHGRTRFGILDLDTPEEPQWFSFYENFFIFHFICSQETSFAFITHACVMENLYMDDFIHLDNPEHKIRGNIRLRKIVLHRFTQETSILTNPYIENLPSISYEYNLDFPLQSSVNPDRVYCCIFNASSGNIQGYMAIDTTHFQSALPCVFQFPEGIYGNSEPQIVTIRGREWLLTFIQSHEGNVNFISLIDVFTNEMEMIPIPYRIPSGFHSIFMNETTQ